MVLATKRAVNSDYGQTAYKTQKVKVRRVKRSTSPLAGVLIIALIFVLGLSYTFMKAGKAHLIWQLSQSKQTTLAMQMENEKLRLEVAKLKSLERIEQIAVSQMGMVKNPGVEYLAFSEGSGSKLKDSAAASVNQEAKNNNIASETQEKKNLLETIASAFTRGILARG